MKEWSVRALFVVAIEFVICLLPSTSKDISLLKYLSSLLKEKEPPKRSFTAAHRLVYVGFIAVQDFVFVFCLFVCL